MEGRKGGCAMSFLREKCARRYFLFLCGIAILLLLFSVLMTWQHTRQVQELLLEREASLVSSLLEQDVPAEVIAAAMKSDSISANGLTFMEQIGHTSATPLPLSPLARQTAISFGILACVVLFLLGFAVLVGSAMYLYRQNALYQTVIHTVNEYSDGIFQNHLPQNENGLLYQMFGGIEELAVALQAKNENEHKSKEFLPGNGVQYLTSTENTFSCTFHVYRDHYRRARSAGYRNFFCGKVDGIFTAD